MPRGKAEVSEAKNLGNELPSTYKVSPVEEFHKLKKGEISPNLSLSLILAR